VSQIKVGRESDLRQRADGRFTENEVASLQGKLAELSDAINTLGARVALVGDGERFLLDSVEDYTPYLYIAGVMQPVTVGAADSGGAGFRLLRVPN
jgi:hypothetical protein